MPTWPRPYHQPNRTTLYPDHADKDDEEDDNNQLGDDDDNQLGDDDDVQLGDDDDDGLAGGVA